MMTSRERVRAVLEGKTPDRVPIDFGATEVTGIHGVAYNTLKKHLGVANGRTRMVNLYMQTAEIEEPVRQRFSADMVGLSIGAKEYRQATLPDGSACEFPAQWAPMQEEDGSEALMGMGGEPIIRRLKDSYWFSPAGPLFPFIEQPEDVPKYESILKIMDRSSFLDEPIEALGARAKKLYEETDYALVGCFGGHVFAASQLVRGMPNYMCDIMMNPALVEALANCLADSHIAEFEHYIEHMGPYVDVVTVADDLGMQSGPQVDPALWRKLVKPAMARLYGFMKSKMGSTKLFLHSCGSVYDFIPDLIEMGVDALNPVQVSAANMDSAKLKAEFGNDIIFWGGGCDTQNVLPSGSVEDVREEVKRRVGDFAPGGGFVFTQVHNLQPGVPPENIVAMYETALEVGGY